MATELLQRARWRPRVAPALAFLPCLLCACAEGAAAPSAIEAAERSPRAVGPGGWEELNPGEGAPPAGEDAAAVLDAKRHRVLVYGGKDDTDVTRSELWSLDLATRAWSQIKPEGSAPPPREDHTLVLDEESDALVLFGGEDGSTSNATWTFDLATERWQDITQPTAPAREGHVAIYDPHGRRMIVFGGMHQVKAEHEEKVLEDSTWALDLGRGSPGYRTWTELEIPEPRPSARREHRGAYDPLRRRLIVFGGRQRSKTSFLGDVWILDLEHLTWRALETHGERPEPIRLTAMGYDAEADLLTVFGGEVRIEGKKDASEFTVDEVHVLDLASGAWSNRTLHPRPMYDHVGVFVPECGGTLVYGGSSQWPGKQHEAWLLRVR